MKQIAIYTAIFGGYDTLLTPENILPNVDYICFTDSDLTSDIWQVRKVPAIYTDPTRCARKYKLLPHRYLSEYDISLWVDGNINTHGDINKLIETYLSSSNIAVYDHMQCFDKRSCVYQEAQAIFFFGNKNGNFKDNPTVIQNQMERYIADSYPQQNGLISSGVILRKHNQADVIDCMEHWWQELKYGSKRDQLSFNYSAWKTELNFSWIQGDIRDNEFAKLVGKHAAKNKLKEFQPINLEYFLSMELANGGGGKEIIKQNNTLTTVGDVVDFFKKEGNLEKVNTTLTATNWQYFNCMIAGFRHNVGNHHDLGWERMTTEYYNSLPEMTDAEIEKFLKSTPVEFDNGFIRHNYHRACAMIGRLINGKSYIPFHMKTAQIYDEPRKKDNLQRVTSLVNNVFGVDKVLELGLTPSDFTVTQSGILALMGIRKNNDIDIIITSEARARLFNNTDKFIRLTNNIEIFEPNKSKFLYYGACNDDDLVNKYSFQVNGVNFLEPRFYFNRKRKDRAKDITDWSGINNFLDMKGYEGYPWNQLSREKWGII